MYHNLPRSALPYYAEAGLYFVKHTLIGMAMKHHQAGTSLYRGRMAALWGGDADVSIRGSMVTGVIGRWVGT